MNRHQRHNRQTDSNLPWHHECIPGTRTATHRDLIFTVTPKCYLFMLFRPLNLFLNLRHDASQETGTSEKSINHAHQRGALGVTTIPSSEPCPETSHPETSGSQVVGDTDVKGPCAQPGEMLETKRSCSPVFWSSPTLPQLCLLCRALLWDIW